MVVMARTVSTIAVALLLLIWGGGALVLLSLCIDLLSENSQTTLPIPLRLLAPAGSLAWLIGGVMLLFRLTGRRER